MSDGTGRIYKRGNVWWIDYGFRGERYRESAHSSKKKVATALLKKRMAECGAGGPMVDEEEITLQDLRDAVVADYEANGKRSLRRVRRAWQHVLGHYTPQRRAVDVTTDRVRGYAAARLAEGAARATVNKELAALRRGFSLMVEAGRLSRGPTIHALHTDNVRQRFLTMEDVEAICGQIGADLAPVVHFAALTGWRKAEVLGLTWSRVDWQAGTLRLDVGTTKNGEGRTFPFAALPPLAALLREQRERTRAIERETGRIVPWVFHRQGDEIRSMNGAWKGAAKRAGLAGAWFHDLRRTAVRNLERAGVSRSVATKLTSHKTESIYRRYAIADADALAEGVEKLARLHGAEGASEGRSALPMRRTEGE